MNGKGVSILYDSVRVKGLLPHARVVVGSDGCPCVRAVVERDEWSGGVG